MIKVWNINPAIIRVDGVNPVCPVAARKDAEQNRRRRDLIEHGLRRARAADPAAPQYHIAEAPAHPREQGQHIAHQQLHGGPAAESQERDGDSQECHANARPLQRAQAFLREHPQSERGENGRRVQKDNRMRGGCMQERLPHEDELERKQQPQKHAASQRTVEERAAPLADQHPYSEENRGRAETDCELHDGCHIGRDPLHRDLLESPDQAQHENQAYGS